MGRLIDLSTRSRDSGQATNGTGAGSEGVTPDARFQPQKPIHEWDVDAVAMLTIERGAVPNVANVRWLIDVDALRRGYEVSVIREGWQHAVTFQRYRHEGETVEQAARREAIVRFLNELLSASYGVPA